MTEEQKKVRKFYKELLGWKVDAIGTWIGAGMLVLFLLIGCSVPVQEMCFGATGEVDMMAWMMLLMFGPLAGFLYLRPYTSMTEVVYTNRPKNVRIIDKLKYLPISLREIRKMKVIYLLKFYGKIVPFCMGLQILTSLYSYNEITWMNVLYILVMAFVWPVATNLPIILTEGKKCSRYGKWIIALVVVLSVVAFLLFPRNMKTLFLNGSDEATAKIMVKDVTGEEMYSYELTGEKREALLELLGNHYARINLVQKSHITEHYLAVFVSLEENEEMLYVFSDEIVSFGGTQYLLCDASFVKEFAGIFIGE